MLGTLTVLGVVVDDGDGPVGALKMYLTRAAHQLVSQRPGILANGRHIPPESNEVIDVLENPRRLAVFLLGEL